MCRNHRRCPCPDSENREAWALRQRRSRAQRALVAAERAGDTVGVNKALAKLAAVNAPRARGVTREDATPGVFRGTLDVEAEVADRPRLLANRIRDLVTALESRPSGWVSLTRLRAALPDVDRVELDQALSQLMTDPDVSLIPESNQKTLRQVDRAAALFCGGEDKHLISVQGP